jgi:type IV secretory pathway VirB6-like protein
LLVSERLAAECKNPGVPVSDMPGMTPGTASESVTGPPCLDKAHTNASQATWVDFLRYFPMVLFGWLLRLVSMLFIGMFLAAYLTVIFMAEILFGAGMTFGPVLVPWLIWKQTEWLFDGWLKFMVTAILTKAVAAFMVMTTGGLIMGLKTYSEEAAPSGSMSPADLVAIDDTAALLLLIVCAMGTYMMWQVPAIAGALTSGGSISAGSFGSGFMSRRAQRGAGGKGGGKSGGGSGGKPTPNGPDKSNWKD